MGASITARSSSLGVSGLLLGAMAALGACTGDVGGGVVGDAALLDKRVVDSARDSEAPRPDQSPDSLAPDRSLPANYQVTPKVSGDGLLTPAAPQSVAAGSSVTFTVKKRISACKVSFSGSCPRTPNADESKVTVTPTESCTLHVDFACGASTLSIYPPKVGLFYSLKTQQYKATQVFASGPKVDVTKLVSWTSSKPGTVTFDEKGLATAHKGHGIVDVTASLAGHSPAKSATTKLTVVTLDANGWWPNPSTKNLLGDIASWKHGHVPFSNVRFTKSGSNCSINWSWTSPWTAYPNGISGRIYFVWSENGGKTYKISPWDWIGNGSTGKGLGCPPKNITSWTGTMLSTVYSEPNHGAVVIAGKSHPAQPKERTLLFFDTVKK